MGREFESNIYKEIPENFFDGCANPGRVVTFCYKAGDKDKTALVYLPRDYDASRRYNVFYLLHGGADNERWYFRGEGMDSRLKNVLDHMFESDECEECLVVTPTYMTQGANAFEAAANFYAELREFLIPAFESSYLTFAEDVTPAGIKSSRRHRAYGGYSLGSLSTWGVFEHCLDEVAYYMPMSGDCWSAPGGQRGSGEGKAKYLEDIVKSSEYSADDFIIYAGCGGPDDVAYPHMTPQLEAMAERPDTFRFCESFNNGNFFYFQCDSGHTMMTGIRTIYNGLPKFFG